MMHRLVKFFNYSVSVTKISNYSPYTLAYISFDNYEINNLNVASHRFYNRMKYKNGRIRHTTLRTRSKIGDTSSNLRQASFNSLSKSKKSKSLQVMLSHIHKYTF